MDDRKISPSKCMLPAIALPGVQSLRSMRRPMSAQVPDSF